MIQQTVKKYPASLTQTGLLVLARSAHVNRSKCVRLAGWVALQVVAERERRNGNEPVEPAAPMIDLTDWSSAELADALICVSVMEASCAMEKSAFRFVNRLKNCVVAAVVDRLKHGRR